MPPVEGVAGLAAEGGRGPVAGLLWIGDGVRPGRAAVCEPLPGVAAVPWPCSSGRKSLLVIGSLYFFRRNFCSTSRSRFGGNALAYFFWKSPIDGSDGSLCPLLLRGGGHGCSEDRLYEPMDKQDVCLPLTLHQGKAPQDPDHLV